MYCGGKGVGQTGIQKGGGGGGVGGVGGGGNICWNRCAPEQIQLNPGKSYLVQYTMNVCAASPAEGTIRFLLNQSPCGAFADTPPLCLPSQCQTPGPQPLHHVSVLHPCASCGCGAALSLVLDSQTPLCV